MNTGHRTLREALADQPRRAPIIRG